MSITVGEVGEKLSEFLYCDAAWLQLMGGRLVIPRDAQGYCRRLDRADTLGEAPEKVLDVSILRVPQIWLRVDDDTHVFRLERHDLGTVRVFLTWTVVSLGPSHGPDSPVLRSASVGEAGGVQVSNHVDFTDAKRDFVSRIDPLRRLAAAEIPS